MISINRFLIVLVLTIDGRVNADSLQTQILEARQLYPLRSYKDIQLFQYTIPPQVSFASFQYKANGSFHCPLKTIAVFLQYGSYPVMSLQNSTYPDSFVIQRMFLHDVTLLSDLIPVMINITNPLPGNWYAAAFLVENTERISQKGLFIPCLSFLSTSLKLTMEDDVVNLLQNSVTSQEILLTNFYRFYASKTSWMSKITLKNCSSFQKCPVVLKARQMALPLQSNEIIVNCSLSELCSLQFVPAIDNWNYISVENLISEPLDFNLILQTDGMKILLD